MKMSIIVLCSWISEEGESSFAVDYDYTGAICHYESWTAAVPLFDQVKMVSRLTD
jgi:hypothetical protein